MKACSRIAVFLCLPLLAAVAVFFQPDARAEDAPAERAVICRVNEIPIYEDEILAEVNYQMKYQQFSVPQPRARFLLKALEDAIVLAMMRSTYPDICQAMQEAADGVMERLNNGEKFVDVCKEVSMDEGTRNNGGLLGNSFGRGQLAFLDRIAFEAKAGDVLPPFLSPYGMHIVQIEEFIEGKTDQDVKCRARHILFMFDPNDIKKPISQAMEKYVDAKVELVDAKYADYVYVPKRGESEAK